MHLLLVIILILIPNLSSADDKYMGVATCASSNCHGSVTPRKGSSIFQNEYVVWSREDAHSKAWKILSNSDSKKIAEHLGIEDPQTAPLCLECHSTYVSEEKRGEKFLIKDGVGCETCHGPASSWLKSHTSNNATHLENVSKGMKDLEPLDQRAKLCLSCHQGTKDKTVNHRLIGAGHPRLTFELDTFSLIQPAHWITSTSPQEDEGSYDSARAWLTGQVVRASEMLDTLHRETKNAKFVPELSLFYCYSCHHSLKEDQWKNWNYRGEPGALKLNLSSLIIVKEALEILNQTLANELTSKLLLLKNIENIDSNLIISTKSIFDKKILPFVNQLDFSKEQKAKLLSRVVDYASNQPNPHFEDTEQYIMAISALSTSVSPGKFLYQKEIEEIYRVTADEESFNPKAFRKNIGILNKILR